VVCALPTFALFRLTPPTALIVDETAWIIAAMNHLLRLGLRVPDDVSLVSTDDHPTLQCCHPPVARIAWDSGPVIRRILKVGAQHQSRQAGRPAVPDTFPIHSGRHDRAGTGAACQGVIGAGVLVLSGAAGLARGLESVGFRRGAVLAL
jgi:hypothetical protein